jgi:hypothetical protein
MMTRKDYVKTAEILSDVSDVVDDVVLYAIAKDFADYFSQDNPRFDANRFFNACGLKEMVEV